MQTISIEEAASRFADLVKQVQAGEEVLILQGTTPLVKLVSPIRPGYASLRGLATMAPDFDAPLDEFADYMP